MEYAESNLWPGEIVIHQAKPHRAMLLDPFGVLILLAVLLSLATIYVGGRSVEYLVCIAGLMFLWVIKRLIGTIIAFFTTEVVLTNQRIIVKTGLIRPYPILFPLSEVKSIVVDQSILSHYLNYGSITVIGKDRTRKTIRGIAEPMKLRGLINSQKAC